MARKKKSSSGKFWKYTGNAFLFALKIPYYLGKGIYYAGKGIYHIAKKSGEAVENHKIKIKRESIAPVHEDFKVLQENNGDYKKWEKEIFSSDSKIGIILGSRGSGKTAFGIKFLENFHAKHKKKCYAIGFHEDEMPAWINVVEDISLIPNDALVLVDEGGVLFNSRDSMSNANKLLGELIMIARHKNLSILFISQNSSNLDVNILRQADFLVLKPSSLLQKEFERKVIQKMYEATRENFQKFIEEKGVAYINSNNFQGFISNPLPSFWNSGISKSFR